MSQAWNYGGPNGALHAAQRLIGFEHPCVDRLGRDPEVYKLNTILCGLAERHRDGLRRHSGEGWSPVELANIADTLDNADRYVARLAIMLVAGMTVVDEAADVFGLPAPERTFRIVVGPPPVDPALAAELDTLRLEVARLAADNGRLAADLADNQGTIARLATEDSAPVAEAARPGTPQADPAVEGVAPSPPRTPPPGPPQKRR